MEELKQLLALINDMPALALWVLAGIFLYKTIIVGSIFGIVRLAITSIHGWATKPREVIYKCDSDVADIIFVNADALNAYRKLNNELLAHLTFHKAQSRTYIHASDVHELHRIVMTALPVERKTAK